MVIRENGKYREFIDECYVHDVMEGQRWDSNLCAVIGDYS